MNFPIAPQMFTLLRPGRARSERGIALVITLILMSVTLLMAVAFLAVSRRERGSVLIETDTVTARLAADSALANAEAQILATVMQNTNAYNFGLLVSTNYVNDILGDYYYNTYFAPDGSLLTGNALESSITNQQILPRPPVFVFDRTIGSTDFRYYLDLNRNGQFDANGVVPNVDKSNFTNGTMSEVGDPEWIGVLEQPDAPHGPNNKFLSRYAFVAMPAGNTLDLNAIHNEVFNQGLGAADGFFRNQGVGTWEINLAAFLADLNTNEWGQIVGSGASAPVGSGNYYLYNQFSGANSGRAFDDARALLAYRYHNDYTTLANFSALFPNYPTTGGAVDLFPFGNPLMTNTAVPFYSSTLPIQNNLWPGSDNTNHYFELSSDLFDSAKTGTGVAPAQIAVGNYFTGHLLNTGTSFFGGSTNSTYDRYTFYRLLSQLGTDSAPETGKLNVNYENVVNGGIVPDMQTNTFAWGAAEFFTNAADRLLRTYTTQWFKDNPSNYLATYYGITGYNYTNIDAYGTHINDPTGMGLTNVPFIGMTNQIPAFGVTDIPVLVNSNFVYRPAVQRLLQMAANIYDATTNNAPLLGHDFPSVFQPLFTRRAGGNIFVTGYTNVGTITAADIFQPIDAFLLATPLDQQTLPTVNIYGVPWIIGAKKGFPSFNELATEDVVNITRKLLVTRSDTSVNATLLATNEAFIFSISNSIGIEFWNSYTNGFTNPVQVVVNDYLTVNLTNQNPASSRLMTYYLPQSANFAIWPGSTWYQGGTLNSNVSNPFYVPIRTDIGFMTNEVYQWATGGFLPAATAGWDTGVLNVPALPQFGLNTTNRLQAFILATDSAGRQHVIDYVHLNGPDSQRNLNAEIQTSLKATSYDNMWDTNLNARGTPYGILSQMGVSKGTVAFQTGYWGEDDLGKAEIDGFAVFMGGTPPFPVPTGYENIYNYYVTNTVVQVPFTPTVTAYNYTTWQVNDPLVHTLASDISFADPGGSPPTGLNKSYKATPLPLLPNIGSLNSRYQPWGRARSYDDSIINPYDTTIKDPLVGQSDDWDFPTYKLPAIGWLGRIHRGTPWQTVYLKATNVQSLVVGSTSGANTWKRWTGDSNLVDADNSAPVQDRLLFDVFTTALNGNASRGQLPINVGAGDVNNPAAGLAAWSAVFSGLAVPTNRIGGYTIIDPAGVNGINTTNGLGALVHGIYNMRTNFVNPDGVKGVFEHVGDILSVPQLSQASAFLDGLSITNGISDALMEWLPQQTMSLLRVSEQPRFVIYSYGQTLKPAQDGVDTSGSFPGIITNYQVTAETVTRAVVHIEGAPTNAHAVIESYNVVPSN